ncbi:LacI family DNA-binding transcriptional regulator [Sphingobacterium faecale]|uniref:LacI family DNA-binding transcriptional regulator n=1 Tax=Sphingobacterium faecale TaxID=2803775 RepID=A0ABS1QZW5_9SPHI|nr:LacI family DNA-binding transcriptional regulator [Sphingobacterium faecale]MBL1407620.1 LacI family DNA-binding transcriptional regulator [Sphingobacterium faecale]
MDGHVTIKTIAKNTNFSLTTVSRVLNGTSEKHRISKTTQKIILEEAKKLGYIPNMAAKTLRSNRSHTVGLIVPSLSNPFFSIVASTVSKMLHNQGYVVLMSDSDNNEKEERKMLQALQAQNLVGLIAIPLGKRQNYELLNQSTIPTVFIDRFFSDFSFYSVSTDHYKSSFQLVEHLIEMGHRKIACIQGDEHVVSNTYRVDGYREALKVHGLTYQYLGGVSFTEEEGYLETKLLLQKKDRPTAILALSDTILLGVLKALKEAKISVPEEVSVVSFDNSSYLDFLEVPVTSIAQPITQIAQLAVRLLLEQIDDRGLSYREESERIILLDSTLIFRSSVADLRNR